MKIKHILYGIALCGTLTACSDLLDIPQNGSFGNQEEFYQSDENVLSGVATIYNDWRASYETHMVLLTTLSDEVSKGGAQLQFFSDWRERNTFVYNSNDQIVTGEYTNLYKIIYDCNLIIDNVKPDTEVMKGAIGDAKFFRAYSYFYLAALWGETVPLVDHLLSADEYHVGRSEAGQVWGLVENDLADAIAVLPGKSSKTDKSQYRVTREAAKVMLGKAYLWQEKYADAAKVLDEVIDSKLYGLWGIDEAGEYDMLLHAAANDCCEKVLDIRIPKDADNFDKNHLDAITNWYGYFLWSRMKVQFSGAAGSLYSAGEGYFPPRKALWDAFLAEEGADGYRFNSTMKDIDQMAAAGITVTSELIDHDGYFNWKNRGLKADLIGEKSGRGAESFVYVNMPVIRYAEVLLLAAEAHVMAGDSQTKADSYVNAVRKRAKLGDKTGVTIDDVKLEKRLELCFEGTRYMDLIRWKEAMDVMKDQGKETYVIRVQKGNGPGAATTYTREVYETNPNAGFKERNWLLPIPKNEMDVNGVEHGGNMTQNPGW